MMKQNKYDTAQPRAWAKELYLHPQPEGLLRVQDHLFTETGEGRCVLLRWVVEADFPVDSYTFELKQLDAADECIGTATVTYGKDELPHLAKGEVFVPTEGIPVQSHCASVRVQLTEVISGNYVYHVKETHVEAGYRASEYWAYEKKPGREDGLDDRVSLRVSSKRQGRAGFILPVAVLSVLLMVFVILYPYIRPFLPAFSEEVTTGYDEMEPATAVEYETAVEYATAVEYETAVFKWGGE